MSGRAWQRARAQETLLNQKTSAQCLPWGAPHYSLAQLSTPACTPGIRGAMLSYTSLSHPDFGVRRVQNTLVGMLHWSFNLQAGWFCLQMAVGKDQGAGPDGFTLTNRGCHHTSGDTGDGRGTEGFGAQKGRKKHVRCWEPARLIHLRLLTPLPILHLV